MVSLGADQRELMEGLIALAAAAVLFSVSFWLISRAESRHWMGYLRGRLESSLTRRRLLLLAGVSFLAVYREAAETVLFTQALLLDAEGRRGEVWMGAAAGLAGRRRDRVRSWPAPRCACRIGPFFAVSGALLCALAISFAGSGIYELVSAGYLPPRPVSFPEMPWMGIHPDLTGLLVQLAIVAVVAGAAAAHALEAAPAVLTVLGKPDCHLCHVMADVARRTAAGLHAIVVERDVREDPRLHALLQERHPGAAPRRRGGRASPRERSRPPDAPARPGRTGPLVPRSAPARAWNSRATR